MTGPLPPGASGPASCQARSRAADRAARIARNAAGASAASLLTSRDTTGSEATGPNSAGSARSTPMSARQSQSCLQTGHPGSFGQQQRARVRHDPRTVSRHRDLRPPDCILHLKSAFGSARI
jgi:hypothetical protein